MIAKGAMVLPRNDSEAAIVRCEGTHKQMEKMLTFNWIGLFPRALWNKTGR